ncbi:hypothetical protein L798_04967 [Zootermopsis nevadensis]|uniref:Uncharacterized protein n=1 Tax=Zootermopsis nevadensis TaxID=136037 RepID=A0A067R9S0_ZOONE|nr:hypothetical protein L798_04967 [Zootermopsis nevadensis]
MRGSQSTGDSHTKPKKHAFITFLPSASMTFNGISLRASLFGTFQISLACEVQLGTEDSRCIQHALQVWLGLVSRNTNGTLEHPHKSTMAKPSLNLVHNIQLTDASILSTKSRYVDQMIREATEIQLYPKNVNKEEILHLGQSWKSLFQRM